ncbi:hypothetical protein V8F20_010892 [Naviculisporaceae sp. PSN 640]
MNKPTLIVLGLGLLPFAYSTVGRPQLSASPAKLQDLSAHHRRDDGCDVWQTNSYKPDNPKPYLKLFDTLIISSTLGPFPSDTNSTGNYDESIDVSTEFDPSVGDPLAIISTSMGLAFAPSEKTRREYQYPLPAGAIGRMGFTPVFVCTTGTLTGCDGSVSDKTETCAPWKIDGVVQGDYTLVL